MSKRYFQLPSDQLVNAVLQRKEGCLSDTGALVINTGEFTGRSPDDKFIVQDESTSDIIDWNKFNNPISTESFLNLKHDLTQYLKNKDELWTRYFYASSKYRIGVHIVNEFPAHNHFAANMFIRPSTTEIETLEPEWTILHAPGFKADPKIHGTRSKNFTVISFSRKTVLIGGTGYTGEIKKSMFTVLNYVLPLQYNVLPMHCSANRAVKKNGDTALFFGLSGTGKTTLSSDPNRLLIGDDEHGWDAESIFNFEGGCYAKTINLSKEKEPLIYNAIKQGALVENTCFSTGSNAIDFTNNSITENTRVSYPLSHIANMAEGASHQTPDNIFFLSCDAYGVLPAISRLSAEQAAEYYLAGYTAKIAGTEMAVTAPKATFSQCFGAPFLPLHPSLYARMLKEKIASGHIRVWMINTGWIGGAYGTGKHIPLQYTRAMINAALEGELENVPYVSHPVFELSIPFACPGIPAEFLLPWQSWPDENVYFKAAGTLKNLFDCNRDLLKLQTMLPTRQEM